MSKTGNLNMIPALLEGLRVLDLTDARGLYAGRMLADLGAEVIHVEPAEGNTSRKVGPWRCDSSGKESSLFWESFSCNKLGLCCDIKTRAGRELISKLCCSCDVLIESADPGVMGSLGLGYADLETIAPQLVYVSITAFGSRTQSGLPRI
jgi:crotonobetainyl-CoA:carnitine CoA-transferase CaiB-like acyl-CoA transferase